MCWARYPDPVSQHLQSKSLAWLQELKQKSVLQTNVQLWANKGFACLCRKGDSILQRDSTGDYHRKLLLRSLCYGVNGQEVWCRVSLLLAYTAVIFMEPWCSNLSWPSEVNVEKTLSLYKKLENFQVILQMIWKWRMAWGCFEGGL